MRLPKCKHVFGDHCIKKWFEESDSCPYCRDKVHSEPVYPPSLRPFQSVMRASYYRGQVLPTLVSPPFPHAPRIVLTFASAGTTLDEYARLMAHHDRETARMAMQERANARLMGQLDRGSDGTPPRGAQTGERRSPPSEASETRRRTRARRGSLRTSQSGNTLITTVTVPAHQRQHHLERVTPPNSLHWTVQSQRDSSQSLTSLLARQSMSSNSQRLYYSSVDPVAQPSPPAEYPNPSSSSMLSPTGNTMRSPVVYMPIDTLAMYASSPEAPPPFSHQLPSVSSLDATAFAMTPNTVDTPSNPSGSAGWMG